MTTYQAKEKAIVWERYTNGQLQAQVGYILINAQIQAVIAGPGTLKITSGGYTREKYFNVVHTAPEPDENPYPDVPTDSEWASYFFLHDWQSPVDAQHPPYTPRGATPAPEVNRIGGFNDHTSHNKVVLNREKQFFWANLLAFQCFGRSYQACDPTQKLYIGKRVGVMMGPGLAFTNRSDPEAANYVAGEWLDKEPAKLAELICGGNTIQGKPAGKNADGREMILIRSFLPTEPLPIVTGETLFDMRIQWATIVYGTGSAGPFPQLRGLSVPVPIFTDAPYYYPADGLQRYDPETRRKSQYAPEREYFP